MTAFYASDTIEAIKARAVDEPCTCCWVVSDPNYAAQEVCLKHLILGLQPTVEAFEPTL